MNKTDTSDTATVAPATLHPLFQLSEQRAAADKLATREVGRTIKANLNALPALATAKAAARRLLKAGDTQRAELVRQHVANHKEGGLEEADALLAAAGTIKLKPGCSSADRARYRIAVSLAVRALV